MHRWSYSFVVQWPIMNPLMMMMRLDVCITALLEYQFLKSISCDLANNRSVLVFEGEMGGTVVF